MVVPRSIGTQLQESLVRAKESALELQLEDRNGKVLETRFCKPLYCDKHNPDWLIRSPICPVSGTWSDESFELAPKIHKRISSNAFFWLPGFVVSSGPDSESTNHIIGFRPTDLMPVQLQLSDEQLGTPSTDRHQTCSLSLSSDQTLSRRAKRN